MIPRRPILCVPALAAAMAGAAACTLFTSFSGIADGVRDSGPVEGGDAPGDAGMLPEGSCGCEAPTVLASGQASPTGIVIDTSSLGGLVYWITSSSLMAADPSGSGMPFSLALDPSSVPPSGIGVGHGYLGWTANNGTWALPLSMIDGGPPLRVYPSGQPFSFTMAPAGNVSDPACFITTLNTSLYCCPIVASDGGSACSLVGYHLGSPGGLVAADRSQEFFFADIPEAGTLGVIRCDQSCANSGKGVPVSPVASSQGAIVFDPSSVYWSDTGAIRKAPRTGTNVVTTVFEGGEPGALAVDGDGTIYFADRPAGTLARLPPGAAAPALLAKGQMGLSSIAIDATSVYFTDQDEGTVKKIAKCSCAP